MSSQSGKSLIGSLALAIASWAAASNWVLVDRAKEWGVDAPVTYGNSKSTNFLIETTGSGVVIFDYDGDGKNDLLLLNGSRVGEKASFPPLLYRNSGNIKFTASAKEAGLTMTGWAQSACAGDIDNDGDADLFVTYYGVNRLLRNDKGRFVDITGSAGLPTTGTRWGSGCAMFDYDRDGRLDLFAANYVDIEMEKSPKPGSMPECMWKEMPVACGPRGLPTAKNYLYHQNPNGTFTDVSEKAGIWKPGGRYGLGVSVADFNNDGWPDIYVACDQTPSLLYQNTGKGTFQERGLEAGVALDSNGRAQAGMGIAIGDFDNSGTLDIAKTNFSGDLPSLYLNEDGMFFRDTADTAGLGKHLLLGWGIAFYDHDEDGKLDLILANGHVYPEVDRGRFGETWRQPTLLYHNAGNGRFEDWSKEAGEALPLPKSSRGLAIGDLNGDGRPEIVISNLNQAPTVLERTGPRGNLLKVTLEGTRSNRSAIGSRVTLQVGKARYVAELGSGSSYYSQHEAALYFGLGGAVKADTVTVRWPSGNSEVWRNLEASKTHHLVEGKSK